MDSHKRHHSHRSNRLEEEFSSSLRDAMDILEDIWHDVGISEDQKNKRERTMLAHFQNLLKEMVAEEDNLKTLLKQKNEECRKDLDQLCLDLGVPLFHFEESLDLLHMKAKLREKHDCLKKDKEERLQSLRTLRSQEELLCKHLALPQHDLNFVGCPRTEQLKELEQNLVFLNQEKEKRSALFTKLQSGIVRFWEDLDHEPESELELQLLQQDAVTNVTLSKENLDHFNDMQVKLELCYKNLLEDIDGLRAKVQCLWNRLEVDENERQLFNSSNSKYRPCVAKALRTELARLEVLKKEHLQKFICGIRKELHALWDRCFYGEEQRSEFQPAFADVFTEDSLTAHEHQCLIMKNFYEENKVLFKKVEKREGIWKKKLEFEERETDANRLNNRGGALLKEEKIRKLLEKELPKVEQDLAALIDDWEKEHETYFLINGVRYLDHIQNQKDEFEQVKEEKRLQRQQAKHDTMQEDMTYVGLKTTTPQKRRFAGTPARLAVKQRKVDIPFTPGKFVHSSICPSPRTGKLPLGENNTGCSTTPKTLPTKSTQQRRSARLRNTRRILSDRNTTISGRSAAATKNSKRRMPTPRRVQQTSTSALKQPVTDISMISYSEFAGGVASDSQSSFVAAGMKASSSTTAI